MKQSTHLQQMNYKEGIEKVLIMVTTGLLEIEPVDGEFNWNICSSIDKAPYASGTGLIPLTAAIQRHELAE